MLGEEDNTNINSMVIAQSIHDLGKTISDAVGFLCERLQGLEEQLKSLDGLESLPKIEDQIWRNSR